MDPEVKESEFSNVTDPGFTVGAEPSALEVNGDEPLLLPAATESSNEQWRQIGERIYTFLSGLPDYLSEFFGEYRRPIITIGLIFGSIVSVKLTLALLDAVNDIPLLAPSFELIGFGYSAWFIYRYLRTATGRQELAGKFNQLKDEVLGNHASEP